MNMLYNKTALKNSYSNNEKIIKELNKHFKDVLEFKQDEVENYYGDGYVYDLNNNFKKYRFEMKQRQNHTLENIYKKYDYITIHKSSVDNFKSDIYVEYDRSYRCCIIFMGDDIDKETVIKRSEITEIGVYDIEYYVVEKEKCLFIKF